MGMNVLQHPVVTPTFPIRMVFKDVMTKNQKKKEIRKNANLG